MKNEAEMDEDFEQQDRMKVKENTAQEEAGCKYSNHDVEKQRKGKKKQRKCFQGDKSAPSVLPHALLVSCVCVSLLFFLKGEKEYNEREKGNAVLSENLLRKTPGAESEKREDEDGQSLIKAKPAPITETFSCYNL